MSIPTEAKERKAIPLCTGVLDYFPDALCEVARVSKAGNEQHNLGQPLRWSRDKSTDHANSIARHLLDRGKRDVDGERHTAKAAWRILALLQLEIEWAAHESNQPLVQDEAGTEHTHPGGGGGAGGGQAGPGLGKYKNIAFNVDWGQEPEPPLAPGGGGGGRSPAANNLTASEVKNRFKNQKPMPNAILTGLVESELDILGRHELLPEAGRELWLSPKLPPWGGPDLVPDYVCDFKPGALNAYGKSPGDATDIPSAKALQELSKALITQMGIPATWFRSWNAAKKRWAAQEKKRAKEFAPYIVPKTAKARRKALRYRR